MSDSRKGLPDFSRWEPGRPETWTHRYARLVYGSSLRFPKGMEVKVVQVSHDGSFGITRDLMAEYGYEIRRRPEDLDEWSDTPLMGMVRNLSKELIKAKSARGECRGR